jgi:apolipoprotein N-acyltransferase
MNVILVVGTKTIVGPEDRDWHNTALILDKRGVLGEYYKARPIHFFNDGIPGRQFDPIQTDLGAFATPICFDCDYSEVARRMVELGAEYFAVPSFDAESWSANQHLQHALLFRLRAAENARWLACAASSGISQIIDPHGNVHRSLPPMETGVLTYRIARSNRSTIFTRVGWLFPWLTLGCSAILLAYAAIRLITQSTSTANRVAGD